LLNDEKINVEVNKLHVNEINSILVIRPMLRLDNILRLQAS
jgi:hypothetical protein